MEVGTRATPIMNPLRHTQHPPTQPLTVRASILCRSSVTPSVVPTESLQVLCRTTTHPRHLLSGRCQQSATPSSDTTFKIMFGPSVGRGTRTITTMNPLRQMRQTSKPFAARASILCHSPVAHLPPFLLSFLCRPRRHHAAPLPPYTQPAPSTARPSPTVSFHRGFDDIHSLREHR